MLSIAKKYPHLVQIRKIGKTFEKRTLFALRVRNINIKFLNENFLNVHPKANQ